VPVTLLVFISILFSVAGTALLSVTASTGITSIALVLLGVGLSGGFPLMLGLVGSRYAALSATAFSVVLVIALIGNMLVNFLVGKMVEHSGIGHFTTVAFSECAVMLLLAILIFRRKSRPND
jgi:hypothetical protein